MKVGNWTYIPETLVLKCTEERGGYEVDLERCTNSAQILDWIFQVNMKTWATPEVVKDLLDIISLVLEPQQNFCGMGIGKSQKVDQKFIQKNIS